MTTATILLTAPTYRLSSWLGTTRLRKGPRVNTAGKMPRGFDDSDDNCRETTPATPDLPQVRRRIPTMRK